MEEVISTGKEIGEHVLRRYGCGPFPFIALFMSKAKKQLENIFQYSKGNECLACPELADIVKSVCAEAVIEEEYLSKKNIELSFGGDCLLVSTIVEHMWGEKDNEREWILSSEKGNMPQLGYFLGLNPENEPDHFAYGAYSGKVESERVMIHDVGRQITHPVLNFNKKPILKMGKPCTVEVAVKDVEEDGIFILKIGNNETVMKFRKGIISEASVIYYNYLLKFLENGETYLKFYDEKGRKKLNI